MAHAQTSQGAIDVGWFWLTVLQIRPVHRLVPYITNWKLIAIKTQYSRLKSMIYDYIDNF